MPKSVKQKKLKKKSPFAKQRLDFSIFIISAPWASKRLFPAAFLTPDSIFHLKNESGKARPDEGYDSGAPAFRDVPLVLTRFFGASGAEEACQHQGHVAESPGIGC